jgi:cation:H+ antiporter
MRGSTDIAVGNVVGSNIFNVLFILGLSALIAPLVVNAQVVRQEVPIMIGASLALAAAAWNGVIGYVDGAIFLAALAGYTWFLVVQARRQTRETRDEFAGAVGASGGWGGVALQFAFVAGGLVLLSSGRGGSSGRRSTSRRRPACRRRSWDSRSWRRAPRFPRSRHRSPRRCAASATSRWAT